MTDDDPANSHLLQEALAASAAAAREEAQRKPSALAELLGRQAVADQASKRSPFFAAMDVYVDYAESASRIFRFAQVTLDALVEFRERGAAHPERADGDGEIEFLGKALAYIDREMNTQFLEGEKEETESLVCGQAVISSWSALEVFVHELLVGVLELDPSRFKFIPSKMKVSLGEFVSLDDDDRVEFVLDAVKLEVRASLSPGVGAFEPTLGAFKLGGAVDDLVKRSLLEMAAIRHCLVHRKGVVDERFLKACGTTMLKRGDTIRVTSRDLGRFFYAAQTYAATITDRVKLAYEPNSEFRSFTPTYLAGLKKLQ